MLHCACVRLPCQGVDKTSEGGLARVCLDLELRVGVLATAAGVDGPVDGERQRCEGPVCSEMTAPEDAADDHGKRERRQAPHGDCEGCGEEQLHEVSSLRCLTDTRTRTARG